MIDIEKLQNDKIVDIIYDLQIQEKITQNTKIINYSDLDDNDFNIALENYFRTKNYQSKFIQNNYCFSIFCKCITLYKTKNDLYFKLQEIKHTIDFIEKNKKQLKDYNFNKNVLFEIFLAFKNNK